MNRNKFVTISVLASTVILAGVAIFTATKVYQRGQEPIAPNVPGSLPFAWDCSKYQFKMNIEGVVTVENSSSRNEPSQTAEVYINEQLVNTFEVPSLTQGESATLGTVTVPDGTFSWRVFGTRDCQNSGQLTKEVDICEPLAFDIQESVEPSITPSPTETVTQPTNTPTNTPSPTETDQPLGGGPTNTPQPTATNTPTATPTTGQTANNPTPTPTSGNIAQANTPTPTAISGTSAGTGDQLPDAGFSDPIYLFLMSGLLTMLAALILAL